MRNIEKSLRKMASKETPQEVLSAPEQLPEEGKSKALKAKCDELARTCRAQQQRLSTVQRELTEVTSEKNRQLLARSTLEGVCRELQKQNKAIKEESLQDIRSEEEKRKKLTDDFQKSLNHVTTMMAESNAQNIKLDEENRQLAERLNHIYEQFKAREHDVERISKQIGIERQLADARCAKLKTEFLIEKQQLLADNDASNGKVASLTKELIESTGKCVFLGNQVAELTAQIDKYTGKYEEFESTMSRSGRVFDHCKAEMNRMTVRAKALEKEILDWKTQYHRGVAVLYESQTEIDENKKVIANLNKKVNQLAKLCRQIQAERVAYLKRLREIGENPDLIQIPAATDDPTVDDPLKLAVANTGSNDGVDVQLGTKPKQVRTSKKGKQKDAHSTCKEIELATLKKELVKVQALMQKEIEAASNRDGGKPTGETVEVASESALQNSVKDTIPKDVVPENKISIVVAEDRPSIAVREDGMPDVGAEDGPPIVVLDDGISDMGPEDEPSVVGPQDEIPDVGPEDGPPIVVLDDGVANAVPEGGVKDSEIKKEDAVEDSSAAIKKKD